MRCIRDDHYVGETSLPTIIVAQWDIMGYTQYARDTRVGLFFGVSRGSMLHVATVCYMSYVDEPL